MKRPAPYRIPLPVESRDLPALNAAWYLACGRRGIEPRVTADDVEGWQRERLAA